MHKLADMKKGMLAIGLLIFSMLPVSTWAHGGASVDTDQCRVIIGSHIVHFTAYQPQLTGSTDYCTDIPEIGMTEIVFDYEDKALRNMTVSFEITKEPEGTTIFKQEPTKLPTGSFNKKVNFTEAGKYRVHVSLENEGQTVDEHIALKVGTAQTGMSTTTLFVIVVLLVAGLYILYLSNAGFKALIDKLLLKKEA